MMFGSLCESIPWLGWRCCPSALMTPLDEPPVPVNQYAAAVAAAAAASAPSSFMRWGRAPGG